MKPVRLGVALLVMGVLAGCGASPTPVPPTLVALGNTPPPTYTVLPTATPTVAPPTATASPTATARSSPSPTATEPPRPTMTPTPEPTATPSVDYLSSPPERLSSPGRTTRNKDYPPGAYEFIHNQFDVPPPLGNVSEAYVAALPGVEPGVCPLTGEPPEAEENLAFRPINIRVDNSSESRPQTGLGRADVVWETLAEAGWTRFTATYHCRRPETVGPVRSARLIDLQLIPMLGALLVHVGAAQPVTDMIWAAPFADRDIDEWAGDPAFYRVDQGPRDWLRTYTTGELIVAVAENRGVGEADQPLRGWVFGEAVPPSATGPATRVNIPYMANTASVVNYTYDPGSGVYWRFQGNTPHLDRATGSQLAADNVLVIFAEETVTPIVEDRLGNRSLHYDLRGQGRGLLFRNGQVWEANWRREGENVLIRIVDENGAPIPLKPGQSFVQIVPDSLNVTWQS